MQPLGESLMEQSMEQSQPLYQPFAGMKSTILSVLKRMVNQSLASPDPGSRMGRQPGATVKPNGGSVGNLYK